MTALGHSVVLVLALIALVKGADLLVEYAARTARRFGVSDLVVGLLITSVGTSLPELASSVAAALAGSSGLVIGGVVGSNIANLGLVLGVAALLRPVEIEPRTHERDGLMVVASAALFLGLALDNRIGRIDAGLFVLLYVAYVGFVVRTDREGVEHRFKDFLAFFFDFEYAAPVKRGLAARRAGRPSDPRPDRDLEGVGRELSVVALALVALVGGAHFVVTEALWLARLTGVPDALVGLSLVAIGTSLPELAVAVTAARRGNVAMIVGNVLGSNIANLLLIGGIAGILRPLEVAEPSVTYTIPIMLFFSIGLLHFIRTDWRVGRAEAAVAVLCYVAFLTVAFLRGWA